MARLENYNGYPAIKVDGKVYPPMMATIRTNNRDSIIFDEEYFRELGKSGIKIFFLICDTEWLKPCGFELFCKEAEALLRAIPDAYIIPRIGLHPTPEWCEENPDETLEYSDGIKKPMHLFTESYEADYPAMYSLASQKWREDAGKALSDTMDKIAALPYADRIIGYFFAAGGTSEWYYITRTEYTSKIPQTDTGGFRHEFLELEGVYADLSPAFRKSFSSYLRRVYGTNEALREAWGDPEADIDNPKIPDCEARYFIHGVDYDIDHPERLYANTPAPPAPKREGHIGHFLDVKRRRDVFDFFRAWHIGVAESVIYFGKLVKERSPELLTGAFYGSAGSNFVYSMGQIGHVTGILDSGVIDFLASPGVYENRNLGGFTGQRQVTDSYALRNTMFIVEEDARTHMENAFYRRAFGLFSVEDSLKLLKREFGRNVCENLQAWWFDQLLGGKRYKHPEIYKLFARQQEIAKESYERDRTKNSEIAFIYDEESYHVVSEETTHQMVELFRNYEIELIGAPSDRYYHNDLADPRVPDYKLYVFVNCFCLSDSEREVIKNKLAKNGATALFLYGQGLINLDRDEPLAVSNMEELTGFEMRLEDEAFLGMFKFDRASRHAIAEAMDKGEVYGDFKRKMQANASTYAFRIKNSHVTLYPALYAEDGECIAHFLDNGSQALNIKKTDGFTSIYCGTKYLSADVVKEIARFAGCHIYIDTEDVLYANRDYITLHASSSGHKIIRLREKASAYELYEEKYYSTDSDVIEIDALKGDTYMFELK